MRSLANSNSLGAREETEAKVRAFGHRQRDYESRAASYPEKGFRCTCINNIDPCKGRSWSAGSLLSYGVCVQREGRVRLTLIMH